MRWGRPASSRRGPGGRGGGQEAYFLFASTEWTFHSGRNEMVHSIPAGMKQFIPAGMEWAIPFRPE